MRNRIVWAIVIFIAASPARVSQGEEQTIRKAGESLAAAFNKGDVDAIAALWAPDADYVDENGKTFKGRSAIAAAFKESLANLKGHQMKSRPISIRFIKPEVAVEDGRMELTAPDGRAESSRYTAIWVKSGDKWLISSARDLPNEPDVTADDGGKLLKDLDWLIGEWASADSNAGVTLNCRWALNKKFLIQEYTVKGKNADDVSVVQCVGWDPISGQLKSWFFDSKGGHGQGLWERNGNAWTIVTEGVVSDGRIGSSVNTLKHVDEKTALWQSRDRELDGHPIADSEIKLLRKQAGP